jgi:hypothetical protein
MSDEQTTSGRMNSMRTQDSASSVAATDKPRPVKRARVAVACQRCKTRKQICSPFLELHFLAFRFYDILSILAIQRAKYLLQLH